MTVFYFSISLVRVISVSEAHSRSQTWQLAAVASASPKSISVAKVTVEAYSASYLAALVAYSLMVLISDS
jgi:hypothetical protein